MLNQYEITLEEHIRWFNTASKDLARRLLIVEGIEGPIGYVQFLNIKQSGSADWGFYARPFSLKGVGQQIGKTALAYAFEQLELHKVCGYVMEHNQRSINLHKSLGFIQEGVLREQHRIDNSYQSLVCFGLLAREWNP
jgi:UDP-4-amino-4,6-dideoxy-N-acetyl-beta-L-altrosamine N-acetyltransferase